jgi:hypothetical protein
MVEECMPSRVATQFDVSITVSDCETDRSKARHCNQLMNKPDDYIALAGSHVNKLIYEVVREDA